MFNRAFVLSSVSVAMFVLVCNANAAPPKVARLAPPKGAKSAPATPASGGGGATFSSPVCSVADTEPKPASPQPGPSAEAEYYKKLNGDLSGSIDHLNADCGTKITFEYDATWKGHWTDEGYGQPGVPSSKRSNCEQLISAARGKCANATTKKSFASKVTKIQCAYGTTPGTQAELRGSTLVGTVGPQACNSDIATPVNALLDAKL